MRWPRCRRDRDRFLDQRDWALGQVAALQADLRDAQTRIAILEMELAAHGHRITITPTRQEPTP